MTWSGPAATVALAALVLAGCSTILGLDEDYGPKPDAGSSSQSAGGSGPGQGGGGSGQGGDGGAGAAGAAGSGGCPLPNGPVQVAIDGWSIDATEIDNEQFAAFVCAGQPRAASNTFCDGIRPLEGTSASGAPDEPVSGVSWCDAFDYCAWAGGRLCGKIGGGAVGHAQSADPATSQWFHVCTSNDPGNHTFPYGNGYDQDTCVGAEYAMGAQQKTPVGSATTCQATAFAVFDLSGNVREWEDACEADVCLTRGGSFSTSDHNALKCTFGSQPFAPPLAANRQDTAVDLGFRCCTDP